MFKRKEYLKPNYSIQTNDYTYTRIKRCNCKRCNQTFKKESNFSIKYLIRSWYAVKCWLFVLFYYVLALFGLFNAELYNLRKLSNNSVWYKYIFYANTRLNVKTVLFQTIQFSIRTRFKCQKQLHLKQFRLASERCLSTQWNVRTVLFQLIRWSVITQFSSISPIYRALLGVTTPVRVDLGTKTIKGYFGFPKAPQLPEPHHQIV